MILFHGSYTEVRAPDLLHSRKTLDFGKGFYTTSIYEQAVRWAQRFLVRDGKAFVSAYEFLEKPALESLPKEIRILEFENHSREWLDFITSCRLGRGNADENWDLIIGGVANDRIFDTLELYFDGLIPAEDAIKRLKYNKPNYQYCFKNQTLIDDFLHFKSAEVIK